MIVLAAPALPLEEAARRIAAGAEPAWVSSPGTGPETDIARDVFAAEPREVVRGGSPAQLESAWRAARARWAAPEGAGVVPVGIGWLTYELGRAWLPLPVRAPDTLPELEFRFYDAVAVHEATSGTLRIVACDAAAAARLAALLARPVSAAPPPKIGAFVSQTSRAAHAAAVGRIQDYLRAGDVYQVNLARRLVAPLTAGDPLWIAAALRASSPAPHAIWMGHRRQAGAPLESYIVGNSPERFLAVEANGVVETRPIKGTRPRAAGAADRALREALSASPKDRAEHVMIVDLERNDLGRVCQTGSVTVDDLLRVVALPTVFHLVSTVRGRLRTGVGLESLLHATFPGGSITGAPKRRAMEIIDELETAPRGLYTGATGWLGANGELDLAVAIRTATVMNGELSLSVGGGIVIDSDADTEWEETEVKARAFRAVCEAGA